MFFVVRSNDSFNFPLGSIKYIVIVIVVIVIQNHMRHERGESDREIDGGRSELTWEVETGVETWIYSPMSIRCSQRCSCVRTSPHPKFNRSGSVHRETIACFFTSKLIQVRDPVWPSGKALGW